MNRRAFTMVEITVVATVTAVVAAAAAASLASTVKNVAVTRDVASTFSVIRQARDRAVQSQGPVVMRNVTTGGLTVSAYSGGDCAATVMEPTPEALRAPVETQEYREGAIASLLDGQVDGICFRPRGGARVSVNGTVDLTNTQFALPIDADPDGTRLVVRKSGELFASPDATTSATPNGTLASVGAAATVGPDIGPVVGRSPALRVIRPEGEGGGGADIGIVTGGGTVNQGDCRGLTFYALSVDSGYALLRIHPGPGVGYTGSNDCDEVLPLACIVVPFGGAPDPYPGHTFPAPFDNPVHYDPFYSGWTDSVLRLTAPVSGRSLTSRQAADAMCAAQFPGSRMLSFHDGNSGTGGWGMRLRSPVAIPPTTFFWTVIGDQRANPWDFL